MPTNFEEEHIVAKANRLAREAVKAAAALHNPQSRPYPVPTPAIACRTCLETWPCKTITVLGEAEEAIGMADEFEAEAMTTHYCGALTRPARMYGDPEPAEYCENEVDAEDQQCSDHDGSFEDERDERAYQDYKERNL